MSPIIPPLVVDVAVCVGPVPEAVVVVVVPLSEPGVT
jgi:hypothetical protein